MSNRTHWKWRIGIGIFAAFLIVAVALSELSSATSYINYSRELSVQRLQWLDGKIQAFRRKNHRLPKALTEIKQTPEEELDYTTGYEDTWDRPLIYVVHRGTYRLTSYAADGKPGGVGLDHDLTPKTSINKLPEPTFFQLLFHPLCSGMVLSAAVCGFLAFLLTLSVLRARDLVGNGVGRLVVKMTFTLVGASFVAFIMTALHVPTGH